MSETESFAFIFCHRAAKRRKKMVEKCRTHSVSAPTIYIKYIAPILKKQCGGSIVNFASVAGMIAYAASVPYGTSKGAVIQLTRNLALDLGSFNIRVNSVSPGHIESPAMDRIAKDVGMSIAEIEDGNIL